MISLAFAAALLGQQPSCDQVLTSPAGQSSVTLTGFIGRDLLHNYIWISDFGCGPDQRILLFFRDDDLRRVSGGRAVIEAIDGVDMQAIRDGRMHVPTTGLKVRAVGRVARDTTLRQLNVESLELLENPQ